ncbi:hypothetical protein [Nocardia asiatica]
MLNIDDVTPHTQYEFLYDRIRAGLEHVLDRRDEWRKLTRDELIDKVMTVHRAGLDPHISEAVVRTGSEVLKARRDRPAA